MNYDLLQFLLGPVGTELLDELAPTPITPDNQLQIASRLRQLFQPEQAQAAMEIVLLRQLAAGKFANASQMFFTRAALEQSSSEVISTYRARRFAAAGFDRVADLGCGIGGDALGLAAHGDVIGVDLDLVRLAMARENLGIYGFEHRFLPVQADLLTMRPLPVQAAFFDPARRDQQGRRFFSMRQYQPPMTIIQRWREKIPSTAVKISPGVNYEELPDDAELEFISVNGDVKEGVLWFGQLHSGVSRRATLLPGGDCLTTDEMAPELVPIGSPKNYLYEPDKAVIRAHLVEALAQQLGADKIDEEIAYLTSDSVQDSPFARCFAVEAVFPFQLKQLRHYLRLHNIGRVTIKKRGSPLEPEALRRQLRLRGSQHRIIFLTHVLGEPTVLIGFEIKPHSPDSLRQLEG